MLKAMMLAQALVCSPSIKYKTPLQSNAELLGYYVEEKVPVNEFSTVVITEDDAPYINSLNYVFNQKLADGTTNYHYFVDSNHGIIKSIRQLYNDVTSAQYMVRQVENHVETYLQKTISLIQHMI